MGNFGKFMSLALVILLPTIIAGIRYYVGTDYEIYQKFYTYAEYLGVKYFIRQDGTISELLFYLVLTLGRIIFNNYNGFLFLASFITNMFVIYSLDYHKEKINMPFSLLIYYLLLYPTSLNIVRQMMAVSIIIYAYRYIVEKRFFKYLMFVLIASLFHATAVIALMFYIFAYSTPKNRKKFIWLLILSTISLPILIKVAHHIPLFSKYFNAYDVKFSPQFGLLAKKLPIILMTLLYSKRIAKKEDRSYIFVLLYMTEIALSFMSFFVIWGFRLSYYVCGSQLFLAPLLVNSRNTPRKRDNLRIALAIYYIFLFIYSFMIMGQEGIFPYRSIMG